MTPSDPVSAVCGQCAGSLGSIDHRARVLDPLLHVLLHAEGDIYEVSLKKRDRFQLMLAAEVVRGAPFWWLNRSRRRPDPDLVDWVTKTPAVLAWVESHRSFRAPLWWPEQVEKSFGGDPPTPHELANALPCGKNEVFWQGHDVAILVSYCCGMGLVDLHEVLGIAESAIVNAMLRGVAKLRKHSPFVLWCLNLNFDIMPVCVGLGRGLQEKLRIHQTAAKNPLLGTPQMFDDVVRSPVFKHGAASGLLPRRLGGRPINRYVMIGEPRG